MGFGGKGPSWRLAEGKSAWCQTPPLLDEGPRNSDDDDGWGSPRHARGKGGGSGRGGRHAAGQPGGQGAAMDRSTRNQRSSQNRVGSRPAIAQTACGRGIFKELKLARNFDPNIAEQEKQRLAKQPVK